MEVRHTAGPAIQLQLDRAQRNAVTCTLSGHTSACRCAATTSCVHCVHLTINEFPWLAHRYKNYTQSSTGCQQGTETETQNIRLCYRHCHAIDVELTFPTENRII